jgi:hypothetical protein
LSIIADSLPIYNEKFHAFLFFEEANHRYNSWTLDFWQGLGYVSIVISCLRKDKAGYAGKICPQRSSSDFDQNRSRRAFSDFVGFDSLLASGGLRFPPIERAAGSGN